MIDTGGVVEREVVQGGAFIGALYSSAAAAYTWANPLDLIGMPAAVLFMAFSGVAFGLILQPPKCNRSMMLLLVMAYTFFSAVFTVMLGSVPHMEWTTASAPAIAGFLGIFAQVTVPAMRNRVKREVQDRGNGQGGGSP